MNDATEPAPFDPRDFLKTLTHRPGVYRMLNNEGAVLYVGKAKDLKRRVSSYFTRSLNRRLHVMVSQIHAIEVTVTHTEAEALILESQLIKSLKPRYNILLRDDKSYPHIHLSSDQDFPRLEFHRGARRAGGAYFGPYPSAGAVRQTLHLMQKLFPVRQCEDSTFNNRTRPCLQYQIKRCSGPCAGLISSEDYALHVEHARMFLEGKTHEVVDGLVAAMEQAAAKLEYEKAALYRDQIAALRRIQEKQYVSGERGDLDIISCSISAASACVQVFFVRGGRHLGNRAYFPKIPEQSEVKTILSAFLAQYYLNKSAPAEILVNEMPKDPELLEEALANHAGRRVRIRSQVRGERARWLRMAEQNARMALEARLASSAGMRRRYEALQQALGLDAPPSRMECFDISHTQGEATVASCVVFDGQGPLKSDYRRFNIEGITPGDDYAAMRQALERRYIRILKGEGRLPDLLFIDGGKGQISAVDTVLQELGVAGVVLVGVAKGPDRRPGLEQLFLSGRERPIILPAGSPALHLIQQIRDEAHRFAITGHRQRRRRSRGRSVLESVPGIGPKRRQNLLRQLGGLKEVARAGIEDLARVEGINRTLAEQIYQAFHGED